MIEAEAKRQAREYYAEQSSLYSGVLDNAMLLCLRRAFGFGEKRLKKAYLEMYKMHKEMMSLYDTDKNEDLHSIYEAQLRNLGFDISKWSEEIDELEKR